MSVGNVIGVGVLFVALVGSGMFAYAAATEAWALVRRKYARSSAEVLGWDPNSVEESLGAGLAFAEFFWASHKKLGDDRINLLCRRVRWGTLLQLAFAAGLVYALDHGLF